MKKSWRAMAGVLFWVAGFGAQATEAPAPYTVSVIGEVRVDAQGLVMEWQPLPEDKQPPAFLQALRAHVLGRQIEPGRDAQGQPGEMEAGLRVRVRVHPAGGEGGGQVRITGLAVVPLIVDRPMRRLPPELHHLTQDDWEGRLTVVCHLSSEGLCERPKVDALPGLPEAARRYVRDTVTQWTFKPIRVNGQPLAQEVAVPFHLHVHRNSPVRQDRPRLR